jgi:hypothetical protein
MKRHVPSLRVDPDAPGGVVALDTASCQTADLN